MRILTEKIKVSKEVAEAIEFFGKAGEHTWYNTVLMGVACAQSGFPSSTPAHLLGSEYTLYELAEILVNGYEVELTPHEKIHEMYKEAHEGAHGQRNIRFHEGVAYGVFETLKALGEKVEGIFE